MYVKMEGRVLKVTMLTQLVYRPLREHKTRLFHNHSIVVAEVGSHN